METLNLQLANISEREQKEYNSDFLKMLNSLNLQNVKKKYKVVSLFSGCGGLDLGFELAGFDVIWANDNNKVLEETFTRNHPNTTFVIEPIENIKSDDIPDCDVIIGGPPCQAWSLAGAMRGFEDKRGQVFLEYIRIIRDKKPMAFVAENVKGIVSSAHLNSFNEIIDLFKKEGYNIQYKVLNAKNYGVPQDRQRVFIIGIREDLDNKFLYPENTHNDKSYITLKDAIWDLRDSTDELMTGSFSTIYMSRNRRRMWDEVSFTIQAGGRHAPTHPDSPDMIYVEKDKRVFDPNSKAIIRRLSVRECARIQTFPDNFEFIAPRLDDKYKMIGNAVPVLLAKAVARSLFIALEG